MEEKAACPASPLCRTFMLHIISCCIVFCRIVQYRILSYHVLSYPARILSYRTVSHSVVCAYCACVPSSHRTLQHHIGLYGIRSHRIISYRHIVSFCVSYCDSVVSCIVQYHNGIVYRIVYIISYCVSYRMHGKFNVFTQLHASADGQQVAIGCGRIG